MDKKQTGQKRTVLHKIVEFLYNVKAIRKLGEIGKKYAMEQRGRSRGEYQMHFGYGVAS